MKVLIAEDDASAATALRTLLENMGHSVTVARNGREALLSIETRPVDVIISDWDMPQMDGLELCRQLRSRGDLSHNYVILITSLQTGDERWQGLEAGADDFLSKPPDQSELRSRLAIADRILHMQTALTETMSIMEGANRRFAELYLGLPIICMTHDCEGCVREWNRAFEAEFDGAVLQILQNSGWEALCTPSGAVEVRSALAKVLQGDHIDGLEWEYAPEDGVPRHFLSNIMPLWGIDSLIIGAISTHVDITDRKLHEAQIARQLEQINQANALLANQKKRVETAYAELEEANVRLHDLASTDGLTGLRNHRAFQDHLRREYAGARRYQKPLSVMLLDIDNFKGFNDSFGHLSGDDILRRVATILLEYARTSDYVARYGGEEFVVVLSNTDEDGARTTAERFRIGIESAVWPQRAITASIGVATLTTDIIEPAELIGQADAAMYASKRSGRNRVIHSLDMSTKDDRAGIAV